MDDRQFIVATAIVVRGSKYLLTQRSLKEEKWPGRWTAPGGTLGPEDYTAITPNQARIYYNILEQLVKREVREETGIEIKHIRYLLSLAYQKKAGPAICLSMFAEYESGEVRLDEDSNDYAWVTVEEAAQYELVEGMFEETLMVDDILHHRPVKSWTEYEVMAARKHK